MWTTEQELQSVLVYGTTNKVISGEVTAEDIINFAREVGVSTFNVKDENGNYLSVSDFPRSGKFTLEPIIKAG